MALWSSNERAGVYRRTRHSAHVISRGLPGDLFVNMPPAFLTPRHTPGPAPNVSHLPGWARLAYEDLVTASLTVGAGPILDELAEDYLTLTGPEECCLPARAYW